jgi:hypothetical protein
MKCAVYGMHIHGAGEGYGAEYTHCNMAAKFLLEPLSALYRPSFATNIHDLPAIPPHHGNIIVSDDFFVAAICSAYSALAPRATIMPTSYS